LYENKEGPKLKLLGDLYKIFTSPTEDESEYILYEKVVKVLKHLKRNKCQKQME